MTLEELTYLGRLNKAFYKTAKISHWKETTQKYRMNLMLNNLKLQEDLRNGTYKVSPTTNFTINERGKIRHIEAPAIRDRIIQKVICQDILLPTLTKYLIYDNYASLKNRGTSFARKRVDVMLRRYIRKYGDEGYVLKIDIRKYFDNIDHEILKKMLHDKIHEPKEVMDLIDYMVDTSSKTDKGLNLGSEVPQVFAIYYLSPIDNYVKTVKGVKYYGRYMDDMVIIGRTKEELVELLKGIENVLAKLGLEANKKKTCIIKLSHGFTFMQIKYKVDGQKVIKRPAHDKIVRERRRIKKYKNKLDIGTMSIYDVSNSYKSWRNNLLKECNTCKKSIRSTDALYNSLFKNRPRCVKLKRSDIIREIYNDTYTLTNKCI